MSGCEKCSLLIHFWAPRTNADFVESHPTSISGQIESASALKNWCPARQPPARASNPLHPRISKNNSAESTAVTSSDPAHPSRLEKKKNTLPIAPVSLTALHLPPRLLLTVQGRHHPTLLELIGHRVQAGGRGARSMYPHETPECDSPVSAVTHVLCSLRHDLWRRRHTRPGVANASVVLALDQFLKKDSTG
jgi:hypothetical protein